MNNFNNDCPDSLELELQFLNNDLGRVLKEHPLHNLHDCPICQKYLKELDGIYESISNELPYPVSNKVLDFACKLSPLQLQKGLFICKPVAKKNKQSANQYQLVMLFSKNNGSKNDNFAGFNFKNQQDVQMSVRVVSDPGWNKLLLFFKHKDHLNYSNRSFTIPGIIERAHISSNGTAVIPFTSIINLNNKTILLYKNPQKTIENNLTKKFQKSIII